VHQVGFSLHDYIKMQHGQQNIKFGNYQSALRNIPEGRRSHAAEEA
jgi:hypothetical protein